MIATTQSGKRPHCSETKMPIPHVMARATTEAHSAASPTFSVSRPRRETSPRTSRAKACSSRSSASIPEASRTVTNISETVTEIATANESRGVRLPASGVRFTLTGWATVPTTSPARLRLATARLAKRSTLSSAGRCGASRGNVRSVAWRMSSVLRRPRMSSERPNRLNSPPSSSRSMSWTAISRSLPDSAALASARRELMIWSTKRPLTGSSLL